MTLHGFFGSMAAAKRRFLQLRHHLPGWTEVLQGEMAPI